MKNFALSLIVVLAPLCNLKAQGIPFPGGGLVHAQGGGGTVISQLGGGNGYKSCPGDPSTGCVTSAINTTGASLLVAINCCYGGGCPFSDSKSNTWTPLTVYTSGSANCNILYAASPSVGSGHTFQDTNAYGSVAVLAFAGAAASPYVASSDTGQNDISCSSGSPCGPGSKSIAVGNVEVTFFAIYSNSYTGTLPSDTDYVIDGTENVSSGALVGFTVAHLIALSTAARNPAWQPSSGTQTVGVGAASFGHL